jgi:hypothetical protein
LFFGSCQLFVAQVPRGMNKKLSSYEKTELIYKQIIADEENEKAKKVKRLRELRLSQTSSGSSNE